MANEMIDVVVSQQNASYPFAEVIVSRTVINGMSPAEAAIIGFLSVMADPANGHESDTAAQLAQLILDHTYNVLTFKEV